MNLRETVDYKLIESIDSENQYHVQIIKGKYTDVIYKYGSVKFHEEKKQLRVSFDYEIIENPIDISEESLKKNPEFKEHMGNILNSILCNDFKIGKLSS